MDLFPPPAREPVFNVPGSVWGMIAVLVAIHLGLYLAAVPFAAVEPYAFVPARYIAPDAQGLPAWELLLPPFSHIFLHGSFLHLTVNCLWLLAFGPVVARRCGGLRFGLFFLVCGLGGAALELVLAWDLDAPMIGASGAISGLMAAAFRMMNRPHQTANRLTPILSRPILLFSALWLATNLLFAFIGLGVGAGQSIAWQAHMGGYFVGLFTIGLFLRRV